MPCNVLNCILIWDYMLVSQNENFISDKFQTALLTSLPVRPKKMNAIFPSGDPYR